MIAIIISLALLLVAWRIGRHVDEYEIVVPIIWVVCAAFLVVFIFIPLCAATGGLLPGYSEGERVGYITKASTKGVFWKTNELQVQIGAGEMAALQEPHPFSAPDSELFRKAGSGLGRKATVHYRQWLIMPYWIGESGYEVTAIRWEE